MSKPMLPSTVLNLWDRRVSIAVSKSVFPAFSTGCYDQKIEKVAALDAL